MQSELTDKASIEETLRIWQHFTNYAEYKELRALYGKVMPEMERHEVSMADHSL